MQELRPCLVRRNEEWEWISYSFSHPFPCLDNLNDGEYEIKNDSSINEILLMSRISIDLQYEIFDSLNVRKDIEHVKIIF